MNYLIKVQNWYNKITSNISYTTVIRCSTEPHADKLQSVSIIKQYLQELVYRSGLAFQHKPSALVCHTRYSNLLAFVHGH